MLQSKILFYWSIAAGAILWLLSFLAFVHPIIQPFVIAGILVGFALVAFRSFPIALLIFFFELAIGNKGSLFSIAIGEHAFGIRLALFGIIMCGWALHAVREKKLLAVRRTPYAWSWPLLLIVIAYGVIYGILRDPSSLVYFDANGYVFYLALLPLTLVYLRPTWWQSLKPILLGASTALAIFTLLLSLGFTLFFPSDSATEATAITQEQILALSGDTAGEGILAQTTTLNAGKIVLEEREAGGIAMLYRWLRDTGNGEVSFIGNSFFRVFSISHLFVFLAFFWLLLRAVTHNPFARQSWPWTALLFLHGMAMAVSFSRSLWLGLIFGIIVLTLLLPKALRRRTTLIFVCFLVVAVLGTMVVVPSVGRLFWERLTSLIAPSQELAASTRLSLLHPIMDRIREHPLQGWGFGTTVSYLAPIPGTDTVETIRVYLFEWAYLDLIVKVGILGLLGFLAFLYTGFRGVFRTWKRERSFDAIGVCAAIVFLTTVHITTPYLNHPLGIGALLLIMMFGARAYSHE